MGSVTETSAYVGNINGDFILKYNKDISNNFNLDALAGVNYNQADTKSSFGAITNLLIPGFYNLSNSTKPPVTGDASSHQRLLGVYAQATVGYQNQLYVTLNARNDWSSTLPIDHNHFFYPGGSLSWVASNTFDLRSSWHADRHRARGGGRRPESPRWWRIIGRSAVPWFIVAFAAYWVICNGSASSDPATPHTASAVHAAPLPDRRRVLRRRAGRDRAR